MKLKFIVVVALLLFSALPALAVVRFGYIPTNPLLDSAEMVARFTSNLEKKSGVKIETVRFDSAQSLIKKLAAGDADFAILANWQSGALPESLHRAVTAIVNGSMTTQMYLLVCSHKNIQSIADLKGQTVAVVTDDTARKLKRYFFNDVAGCRCADNFKSVRKYADIHSAVRAVAKGQAAATCISDATFATLMEYDPSLISGLQVLKRSPRYPNPFVVFSASTYAPYRQALVTALLAMQQDDLTQNLLMQMKIDGFGTAHAALSSHPKLSGKPLKALPAQRLISGNQHQLESVPPATAVKTIVSPLPEPERRAPKASSALLRLKRKRIDPQAVIDFSAYPAVSGSDKVVEKSLVPTSTIGATDESGTESSLLPVVSDSQQQQGADSAAIDGTSNQFNAGLEFYRTNHQKIILFTVIALLVLVLVLIKKYYRHQQVVVLMQRLDKIVAIRMLKKHRGMVILQGETQPVGAETAVLDLLQRIGHHSPMKLIVVCTSDTSAVYGFSLPILDEKKIVDALYWKLKEKKIPAPEDRQDLAYSVRNRDRKSQTMNVDLQINLDKKANCPCRNLAIKPTGVLSTVLCLLTLLRQHPEYGGDAGVAMLYVQSAEKAIFVLPGNTTGLLSRHVFSFVEPHAASTLASFQTELQHTINYFHTKNGSSFHTLLVAGPGLQLLDQSSPIAELLGLEKLGLEALADMNILRINLASVVKVRGLEKVADIPEVELMVGAATTDCSS